jgi:cardiolipin synthase A/B
LNSMLLIGLIALIFVVWLRLDYYFGRKKHLCSLNEIKYPLRKSDIELYIVGEHFYKKLFEDIENSKHSIHVLFYIVKNDPDSDDFLALLIKKAEQGIEVRLLLDYVGSKSLKKEKIEELKKSGISFSYTHNPAPPYFFYTLQARNHRKITVIDGKIGYSGGFNIGKEYLGKDPKLGFWRDYHLRVTNEGVQDLQSQFLCDWHEATDEDLKTVQAYFPPLSQGTLEHQFLSTYGQSLESHFLSFIKQAQKELMICTPYFIPGKQIQEELIKARRRGVDIKILVPMRADHPFVKEASFPYFGPLLLSGCEIYQYYYGFYHAKVIVVDDKLCDIGTANFDKRSLYLNDEMNCLIYDKDYIKYVKDTVNDDIRGSVQLTYDKFTQRPISQRGLEAVATMISHFL